MDEPQELSTELLALTYLRLIEGVARQAFDTGRTAEFLAVATGVCATSNVEPVSDRLLERLVSGLHDPYDRFLVQATLHASTLWEAGYWSRFLGVLTTAFTPDGPASTGPARRPHAPTTGPPRRPTRHPPPGR